MARGRHELDARKDKDDIIRNNYMANKDYIDQEWSNCLSAWNEGVYFNAGMFYAYTMTALT